MSKPAGEGKLRRLLRFLVTPAKPMDTEVRIPVRRSFVLAVSVGLVILEFWYFSAVPYAGIPTKLVFWIAFICWGIAPVYLQWRGRNLPTKRAVNMQGNFFIGFGIVGLILVIAVRSFSGLLPVVEAAMPGAMAGGLVSALGSLSWQKSK